MKSKKINGCNISAYLHSGETVVKFQCQEHEPPTYFHKKDIPALVKTLLKFLIEH